MARARRTNRGTVTILDVARAAGVSTMTVSRVMNGAANVRDETRARVLEAIEVPFLILGTSADRLVSWPAIRRAAARLPRGELVAFGREARHELLRANRRCAGRKRLHRHPHDGPRESVGTDPLGN